MKKIILTIMILMSAIAYSTSFGSNETKIVEFKEFYTFKTNPLGHSGDKIPTKNFFEEDEVKFYAEFSENAEYVFTLMNAETREKIGNRIINNGNNIEHNYGKLPIGEYTIRGEINKQGNTEKTIREISFVVLPKKAEISIPETNPLLIILTIIIIITIIHRN